MPRKRGSNALFLLFILLLSGCAATTIDKECPVCPAPETKEITKYVCLDINKTVVDNPDDCRVTPSKLVIKQINIFNETNAVRITGEVTNEGTSFYSGNYRISAALYYKGKVQSVQNYGSPSSTLFGGQTKGFQFTFSKMDYDDYKVYLE